MFEKNEDYIEIKLFMVLIVFLLYYAGVAHVLKVHMNISIGDNIQ